MKLSLSNAETPIDRKSLNAVEIPGDPRPGVARSGPTY